MVGPTGSPRAVPLRDLVLAGVLCLLTVVPAVGFLLRYGSYPIYVANLVLTTALALVQPWRRTHLRTALVTTYGLLAAYAALAYVSPVNLGLNPVILTAATSLHAVTRWEPDRRWGVGALLTALAGSVVNPVTVMRLGHASFGAAYQGTALGFSLVCVLAIVATFLHAASARSAAEERDRLIADATATAVSAERLAIARELHDLVGHTLTAVKVQAATGLALGDETHLREALTAVRDTSDTSLAAVRDMVGVLRGDDGRTSPQADLTALPATVATVLPADLALSAQLPDAATLTAWNAAWSLPQRLTLSRALTEAVTNVARHGGSRASISLGTEDNRCHLLVTNTLPGPERTGTAPTDPAGTGHGLLGLGERVRLAGGSLAVGPVTLADGAAGFSLDVTLPVNASADPAAGSAAGSAAGTQAAPANATVPAPTTTEEPAP